MQPLHVRLIFYNNNNNKKYYTTLLLKKLRLSVDLFSTYQHVTTSRENVMSRHSVFHSNLRLSPTYNSYKW